MSSDETAADVDAPEVEMETVGVDEMVRQERVRSVLEAKKECREKRTNARSEHALTNSKDHSALFRSALESYVREVEPLFSQTDTGRRYWTEYDFGAIDLRPKHEEIETTSKSTGRVRGAKPAGGLEGSQVPVTGLKSLFDLDAPIAAPFRVPVPSKRRGGDMEYEQMVFRRHFPTQMLDKMYSLTNGYLAEIGFDIEVGKAEQHTKLDDDLLDEVEAWRRENL